LNNVPRAPTSPLHLSDVWLQQQQQEIGFEDRVQSNKVKYEGPTLQQNNGGNRTRFQHWDSTGRDARDCGKERLPTCSSTPEMESDPFYADIDTIIAGGMCGWEKMAEAEVKHGKF
jgi:hypothetical protein